MFFFYPFDINTYNSITKPSVIDTISVEDWFSQIQHSTHSDLIIKARNDERIYEEVKFSMPCVTYNFLFDRYKKNTSIISSTGLIYLDIDNPLFDINSVDLSKVYAYYRSFGGHGYAILVKVNNLSVDNFNSTYQHITNELGISEYIDIQAAKATQFNVLSFDKDLFINKDSIEFNSIDAAPSSIVIERKKETYTLEEGAVRNSIRFDNLDEIHIEGDYIVNWEGYEVVKCFIPMKKRGNNHRNSFLLSYCNNLVWLNPKASREKVFQILSSVNTRACVNPVDSKQINRVINSIFKYLKDGTLKPITFWKKRKIVFHQLSKMTKDEKLGRCVIENALRKIDLSHIKLYAILENWDFQLKGAISQRKIYKDKSNHIGKNTVEKYWNEFKDWITEQNKEFKNVIISVQVNHITEKPIAEKEHGAITLDLTNDIVLDTQSVNSIEMSQPVEDKKQIELSEEYFTIDQIEILKNFNPPKDEILNTHLKLAFARNYLIKDAARLRSLCNKEWEFSLLVDRLIEFDLDRFERSLKELDRFGFKNYYEQKSQYVNEQKELVRRKT